MKPLGPIPAGYGVIDGELAIAARKASELAAEAGRTPLFVYSADLIRRRVADLYAALPPRVALHYAVKANPYGPVLELMSQLVDGFDIASAGELALVRAAGVAAERISFAGPGKRTDELEAAIQAGATLNLESEGEAVRALEAGHRLGITPRLAIRVNPDFDLRGSGMKMGGGAKPFGLDAERVPALARRIVASFRKGSFSDARSAPCFMKMMWARRSGGSSRSLRNSEPLVTGTVFARRPEPSGRQCSWKTRQSLGHL